MHFSADTLDDVLNAILRKLLKSQTRTQSTKGPARELMAVSLKIKNPRARFSRTENRATLFSCLGETLWYLSGSNQLNIVEYYIPNYRTFSDLSKRRKTAPGAYGPRIFGSSAASQMETILEILKRKNDTRQAVIQIFDASDLRSKSGDVPCTCTLQFMLRGGRLHLVTNMRSNDAYIGLPHDVFAFTMIQEVVARILGREIGTYNHFVGSLHLYDRNEGQARRYLAEGWQEKLGMPPMPFGDPRPKLCWLHRVEAEIRLGSRAPLELVNVDPYWADLARLLRIKALLREKLFRDALKEALSMSSDVYMPFIRGKERRRRTELQKQQLSLPELSALEVFSQDQALETA